MAAAIVWLAVLGSLVGGVTGGQQPEAMSLLGRPLVPAQPTGDTRRKLDAELRAARSAFDADPADVQAILRLGRATAALGRLGEALEIYTRGIETHPDEASLLEARGLGYIVIRKFNPASKDLRKAADIDSVSSCSLGLLEYLKGEYAQARDAYQACGDRRWLYLVDRRLGQLPADRPATPPDEVFAAYMAAVDRLADGNTEDATERLKQIVDRRRNQWMTAAYIAAEADLARLLAHQRRK